MQNAFDGLINRLDTAEKRIWAPACYQQNSQTRKQENKDWKKKQKTKYPRIWDIYKGIIYT